MSAPAPQSGPDRRADRLRRDRWWWLALFLAISLLLHLVVGWESRAWKLSTAQQVSSMPFPAAGETEVILQPAERPLPPNPARKTQAAPAPKAAPRIAAAHEGAPVTPHAVTAPEHHAPAATPAPVPLPSPPTPVVQRQTPPETHQPVIPQRPVLAPLSPPVAQARQPQRQAAPLRRTAGQGLAPHEETEVATNIGSTAPVLTDRPTRAPLARGTIIDEPAPAAPAAGGAAGGKTGLTRGIPFSPGSGLSALGDGGGSGGQPLGETGGGASGEPLHVRLTRPTAASIGSVPAHIVYILDVSGSMNEEGKIGLARQALEEAVSELVSDDTFALICFSDTPHLFGGGLRAASNRMISALQTEVETVTPRGQTDLSDALDMGMALPNVTHIFLISDGEPTTGIVDHDLLRAHIRAQNRNGIQISTFALGDGEQFEGVQLLRAIAEENGGTYRYINDRGR